ncbi:MAG: DUF3969 family protein [Deltaproteobacteria bacterium]|nr:DUF3969 family protein [Deltaproteobacteria bacterium]MBW2253703.1 DUF3969 family protein [Deltaproteobacteria bacterium]
MPKRFGLDGVVVDEHTQDPLTGVGVVARAQTGEIIATARTDERGVFQLRVAPAALRGLRWDNPSEPTLKVSLDRHEALELAGGPEEWRLLEGPSIAVTLQACPASEGPRQVLPFAATHPGEASPPTAEPGRPDVLVATLALGLSVSMRLGKIDLEQARRWLFNPETEQQLVRADLPDDILELVRRGIALEEGEGGVERTCLAELEHRALELLRDLADADGGTPLL